MSDLDYKRLNYLSQRINEEKANEDEKKEYITMLYSNGSLTKEEYENYERGVNTENIIKTALMVGGILLLGYLLNHMLKK